ncbi:hypothetical protein G169_gp27 [Pseudomonas phage AF]|uniref:hypothetical protein n=1 Tax=Pseudomonas phage AF TaxID=1235689 RepID=UPI0002970C50|nr:hypothetical protein G169_gp27 [Pseudomonas phage AF]AFV50641.1 hypothetical protein AF_027 [Pseudomonas phage AF]
MKQIAMLLLPLSLAGCEVCLDASGQNCKQAREQCAAAFLEAPHEQQPEPMLAKQGFGGERWVL